MIYAIIVIFIFAGLLLSIKESLREIGIGVILFGVSMSIIFGGMLMMLLHYNIKANRTTVAKNRQSISALKKDNPAGDVGLLSKYPAVRISEINIENNKILGEIEVLESAACFWYAMYCD